MQNMIAGATAYTPPGMMPMSMAHMMNGRPPMPFRSPMANGPTPMPSMPANMASMQASMPPPNLPPNMTSNMPSNMSNNINPNMPPPANAALGRPPSESGVAQMPRRKAADGAPAPPKAPRVRKKKVNPEEAKPPDTYEPLMQTNGYAIDDGTMYTQDYGYAFGSVPPPPPPFASPEPAGSPYLLPPSQSNTPQPSMMMRTMPPPPQASTPLGPAPSPLEFRVHEMNRRLYIFSNSGICEKDYAQWWDAFSHEFFDDEAKLWLTMLEDPNNPTKYAVGRQLIPRFFRSIFENGMKELCFVLRGQTRESQLPNGFISFENENVLQVTKIDNPNHTEINTECKMYIEFTPYDELLNHRIRSWSLEMRSCEEFFFNEMTKEYERIDPMDTERRISRMGFQSSTINCLSLCKILEPMQLIMSNCKAAGNSPRDMMKRTIFQHFDNMKQQELVMGRMNQQSMMPPAQEEKPKPARKRQRKPAANNAKNKKTNASPAPANPTFPPNPIGQNFSNMGYQDVMVVGEPSMMGGDFGEEDERTISRVENTQYDPSAIQMRHMQMQPMGQPMGGPGLSMGPPMGPPPGQMGGPMSQPMPIPNAMPPGYGFPPQQTPWPNQPPNTTMITG